MPANIPFGPTVDDPTAVSSYAFPITPDDGNDLPIAIRAIRASVAGNIAVQCPGFPSLPGFDEVTERMPTVILPIATGETIDLDVYRVLAAGTTATGLTGYV